LTNVIQFADETQSNAKYQMTNKKYLLSGRKVNLDLSSSKS